MPQRSHFLPATSDFPSGTDTPRDLLERCLARFEEFEPAVGTFVCHDIARRALPRTLPPSGGAGRPLWPIDAMPVAIKDIIEPVDMPTEQGPPLFIGCRPPASPRCARPAR
jgi:Asp-tRNA(Asn)/Glu-tRNA(Gln) amidotransferase A subunit family amidase